MANSFFPKLYNAIPLLFHAFEYFYLILVLVRN